MGEIISIKVKLLAINNKRATQERKEADQLFSKFAAYELAFAYLLFESFGRQS